MKELTLTSLQIEFLIEVLEECQAEFNTCEFDHYWSKCPENVEEALQMLREKHEIKDEQEDSSSYT